MIVVPSTVTVAAANDRSLTVVNGWTISTEPPGSPRFSEAHTALSQQRARVIGLHLISSRGSLLVLPIAIHETLDPVVLIEER